MHPVFYLPVAGAHRRRKKRAADARRVFREEREGLASCDCFSGAQEVFRYLRQNL